MFFSNLLSRYNSRHLNGISAKNKDFVPTKDSKGITLVALVVTIVVLLILAGITITMLFGENGIIKKAQDAADATKNDQNTTEQGLQNLANELANALGENGGGSGGDITIPEGLEVGSTVSYSPSGTYNWQATYCSSTKTPTTDDVTLSSADGQNFNIQEWKVLSIDETTKNVTLVPSNPTSGTVYLGEAQGYNNGVKLLNDACSSLYGNTEKGITARSINIKDIEDYMLPAKLTEVTGPSTNYKKQPYGAYTSAKNYPVIYAQEEKSVINGTEKTTGLGLSDSPENFIERSEGTSTTSKIGIITTATSIQPYHAYWYKDATYMSTAFKPFDEENTDKGNYYSLIMPKGTSTTYWVASRCIYSDSSYCYFVVRYVYSGEVNANNMCDSNGITYNGSYALYPVITLSSGLIEGDTTSGFSVK